MHVLPRVRELERRHPAELVVIGVHSGKFIAERKTENIRQACARLRVEHPVVNDRHFRQWRAYSVQAWPTVALVDPEGDLLAVQAGEFDLEDFDRSLSGLISAYTKQGKLSHAEVDLGRDPAELPEPAGPLRYPGRAIAAPGRLFVADTGNSRVLELELAPDASRASITHVFGTGVDGYLDGNGREAQFAEVQGLALSGEDLYVADRRNHAIRKIDLAADSVTTVAGTGRIGSWPMRGGRATSIDLRSPWGVAICGDTLFVAMAGSHQIWALDITGQTIQPHSGTGGEAIGDGRQDRATLAQPTGLVCAEDVVYFADSESSAVRRADVAPDGTVRTIVGTGLFEFGDRDGVADAVLLEHVQDVAVHRGKVIAADTYNDKLKVLDPATRECVAMTGEAGSGEALQEPSGVWADDERILVADTNGHRIVSVDPENGDVTEIEIE